MQYLNEDYKNYFKQRLIESILVDPGLPGEEMQTGIGGAIRRGLGRLFRRPKPIPTPSLRFPPDNVTKIIRKHYPYAFSLVDGGLKWIEVVGQNGTRFWVFQMPDGTIHGVSSNGTIIRDLPKEIHGQIIDRWDRNSGASSITLPFIISPDGTINTYDVSDETDGVEDYGEITPGQEATAPYRMT